jgi:hypothetical protein
MTPDRNNVILTTRTLEAGGLPSEAATGYLDGYLEDPQNWNEYAYVRNNPLRSRRTSLNHFAKCPDQPTCAELCKCNQDRTAQSRLAIWFL